ncbi:MAG: FprA family A-type flavoprotein [Bacillota bacterium]
MRSISLANNIHWVGVLNPTLRVFDVFMPTAHGTTYNAYLVKGDKTAIIDTVHEKFTEEFVERISQHTALNKIEYLVVNHTELDHAGSIARFLELAPQAKVVSTRAANQFLKAILNRDFDALIVNDGDTLDLGGKTLQFVVAPFWHWPDTMFTYAAEDHVLFSCDGFGSHFCDERMFNDRVDDFWYDFKFYFDHIMRPFADKILAGVAKVKQLELKVIAPSHGPILRSDLWRYVTAYEEWSISAQAVERSLAVIYVSAYSNTKKLAEAIAKGAMGTGAKVKLFDATALDLATIQDELETARGLIFGSPTINGDALAPVWNVINAIPLLANRGKAAATFGSYGWSGEATRLMDERLKGLKLKVTMPPFKVNFVPTAEDLAKAEAFGADFANSL